MVVMAVITVAADTVVEVIERYISLCDLLQHDFSTLVISALALKKLLTLLELRIHFISLVAR